MEIVMLDPKKLIPYEKNAKKHDNTQIKNVAKSIEKYGFKQNVLIDKNNIIVVGHCRVLAAVKLKLKEVPCVYAENMTEDEIREYRLLDNKLNESEWDMDLLSLEMADLDFSDFDLDWGMDEEEEKVVEDDFDVDAAITDEPIAKLGDVWQLGRHRVMRGDSTDAETVALLMDGVKADMVFTDPPYGVDYKGINNDNREGLEDILSKSFQNMKNSCNDGVSFYCFHSDKCSDIFNNIYRKYCHFSSVIIWVKNSIVLSQTDYQSKHEPCLYGWFNNGTHKYYGDRKQTSVWEYEKQKVDGHTTPKPIKLICNALENSSEQDNAILDLFGGSGSTLIACEQLNRICYMMELDPKYVDVIIARYEKFTGSKAVLLNG